ncbi:SDR family oxidoreductase [Kocuria sp. cx-116]|uniref:SDR family oxidoreductase n=1 Tax=Kocuria sp. cx-116 TaxID=2771378 RepID=UPI001689A672|nr:SDR family oxidoreductase [Kocuria sp. cx-116]MBD2763313.1 SDR family oxidoreductase [Kocuria sp. cx-116]
MSVSRASLPLSGQTALVTGVSRRRGIGFAVARAFARLGASVFIHHYGPHDQDQPWGADDLSGVVGEVRAELTEGAVLGEMSADLQDTGQIQPLIDAAHALTGSLDILVCNHAKSGGDGSILDMTPEALDAFWNTNTRSTLLLTRAFALLKTDAPTAAARPGDRVRSAQGSKFSKPIGRVFWLTSGQGHGPMRGEVAYAASKAALAGVTATVAAELLELGIVLNTVNPGPVDTGYLTPDATDRSLEGVQELLDAQPFGRFGEPGDPAKLISWLATDDGAWIVGQVLTSDGGFYLG